MIVEEFLDDLDRSIKPFLKFCRNLEILLNKSLWKSLNGYREELRNPIQVFLEEIVDNLAEMAKNKFWSYF